MTGWVQAVALDELAAKRRVIFRHDGRQIALFHTETGVLACNNRCPHEGYPLREGSLDGDCVLTCNWHNWKFDLKTGQNLYGGDRLRVAGANEGPEVVVGGGGCHRHVWSGPRDRIPHFEVFAAIVFVSYGRACH